MGFRAQDVIDFGRGLLRRDGVSGVWVLAQPFDVAATLWVLIQGFDDLAFKQRLAIREEVEEFIRLRTDDMHDAEFVFQYHVLIDDPSIGSPQIPTGAEPLLAA